jgi:hypothetical protein
MTIRKIHKLWTIINRNNQFWYIITELMIQQTRNKVNAQKSKTKFQKVS